MDDSAVTVLLIEDDANDARLIRRALNETQAPFFQLEHVSRLSAGVERIPRGGIDVVLLDLSLPDSHGFASFSALHCQFPNVPVVLLTGIEDEKLAVQAAREGAQDYIMKSQVDGRLLARAIRYAFERHRLLMESERQARENARLYHDLEASKEEMAVVDSVASIITSTLDIEQAYERFALEVKKLVDFDRIQITVEDESTDPHASKYLFGVTRPEHFPGKIRDYESCQEHQPVISRTLFKVAQCADGTGPGGNMGCDLNKISSWLDVPLISNGRTIGSMGVRSCRPGAYGEREQTVLERLASQIAPALEIADLYQQLQSSMGEMAVVDEVARIMTSTLETHQVYEDFALEMKKLLDFELATISLADSEAGVSTVKYVYSQLPPLKSIGSVVPLAGSQTQRVVETGQTIVRQDLREDPTFADDRDHINLGLLSSIAVPLISKGRAFGSLVLRCPRVNAYGRREQAILERLASQVAPAIENAELYQDLQTSFEEMEVADRVAGIITSTLEIDQVYEMFAQEVKKLADFDRIIISTAGPNADEYTINYYYGIPVADRRAGTTRKLIGTYIEKAMLERNCIFREYPRMAATIGDRSRFNAGLRSGITIPLIARRNVIGALTLDSCRYGTYGQRERIILERLANQIAPAIENARLFHETLRVQESLRESEARFRQLYDQAPVGYQEINAQGLITRVNRTELEMLGYTAEEMLGQPAWKFIVEQDDPEITPGACLRGLWPPSRNRELTFQRKDGVTIPTLTESRPLLDDAGEVVGLRCIIQDITERKRAEEQLRESNRLASIGELAAGVAHEINNPLTSILGFSQILLTENLPQSVVEDVQKIYFSAQRASKIVQNLLSFARKHDPEKRLIDLTPVLERALDLKSFDFKHSNIEVTCQLEENLPKVMADEFQLIQVIMNILNNAQQATRESETPGRLVIRTSEVKDRVRISISDNGPGIPPEHLSKIFQPFFTTKSVGTGTGLGLSICYGIMQQHAGELWAESNPGDGSTFHVELPIGRADADTAESLAAIESSSSYARHLLVVDDEPHIRDLLARSLGQQRYTVDLAGDGQEAWRKLQSRSYDCIIMDLKMPNMSGEELYGLITQSCPELAQKSIFMTGDMVAPETQAFVSSVSGPTLSKPFELEELRSHIHTLLEK